MSRTDDLKRQGARSIGRGAGGSAPFVKFGDEYCFVEGIILDFWTGEYGRVAKMRVTAKSKNLMGSMGADEPQEPIEEGATVNVGLNYAALEEVTDSFLGSTVHIAFIEWGETKKGQRFRAFDVLEVEAAPWQSHDDHDEADSPPPPEGAPDAGVKDSDIPFVWLIPFLLAGLVF